MDERGLKRLKYKGFRHRYNEPLRVTGALFFIVRGNISAVSDLRRLRIRLCYYGKREYGIIISLKRGYVFTTEAGREYDFAIPCISRRARDKT